MNAKPPLIERIHVFASLGAKLKNPEVRKEIALQASLQNPWFTPEQVHKAFASILPWLTKSALRAWTKTYDFPQQAKRVGVIAAGNIPMVGFHDALATLLSGHRLLLKMSSQDIVLMRFLMESIANISPALYANIDFCERLNDAQAVIATGSDNTASYFDFYFKNIPHVVRRNRSASAIITGDESEEELHALGEDVFSYFGLGCRNVSRIFVPVNYSCERLLDAWSGYKDIIQHHKYANNYDYQKAILLVNRKPFLDNGFALLTENDQPVSPISVTHIVRYQSSSELSERLQQDALKTQCVIASPKHFPQYLPMGSAQRPALNDYADGVDTLAFLAALS